MSGEVGKVVMLVMFFSKTKDDRVRHYKDIKQCDRTLWIFLLKVPPSHLYDTTHKHKEIFFSFFCGLFL